MPHRKRRDEPGDWFHIMNRAIARRTMFEQRSDIEFFLDRIGETVEEGWLEVHSYTVLSTHFHMLVRSPIGEMARALHRVQLNYSRYFNRTRGRDGPLVRGRYRSKHVGSTLYRRVLVGYIDANASSAGLARRPDDYAFGSCRAYVWGGGPDWLSRDMIHAEVAAMTGSRQFDAAGYVDVFGRGFTSAQRELVEQRILRQADTPDASEDLLGGGSVAVTDWLRRKARLADGTMPGIALVAAGTVDEALAGAQLRPPANMPPSMRRTPWTDAARVLLLSELSGLTQHEIATRLRIGRDLARKLLVRGRSAVAADQAFAEELGRLGHTAARRTYGAFVRPTKGWRFLRPEVAR